jgi:hypothetical protein
LKKKLEALIYTQGYPDNETAPIVSVADFFNGNSDESSIGCNLMEHPGLQHFNEVLLTIRNKEEVQEVFVEIMELEDESDWAFSERIYVLTRAHQEEVEKWVESLHPSEIDIGYQYGEPSVAPPLFPGYQVYSIWWD